MIYHVTTLQDWESQRVNQNLFRLIIIKKDLFIAAQAQLAGVVDRYFKGRSGLVLLHLDESKLKAELKYEISTNDEEFPHLYGAINCEAIISVMSFRLDLSFQIYTHSV